jgi:uncharacterized OB-fold protein
MVDLKRPLPNPQEHDTRALWDATKDKQLRYQRCGDCGTIVFYPRAHCTGCLGTNLTWHTASGRGTVYTFSVVRKAEHPFFRGRVPYAVAWIDLDEGPRLLSNVVGIADPSKDIKIGQKVMVEWETHDELSLPLFKPVREPV